MISFVRDARRKIFWIFDPNLIFIFKKLNKKYFLLYDCVDFFSVGDIKNIDLTNRNEKYICRKADLVVANSHVLQNHLMQYRKGVALVPQGFRQDGFKVNRKKYVDLKLSGPVIGFVGGINDRLDLSILYPLIKNNRKWNFVLWGPVQEREKISESYWNKLQKILNLPNVTSGMSDDKSEIPGIVSQFDIGMIPYDISQNFNKFCYPMKLFEYFYVGIPVISTPIIELGYFKDLVFTGNNDKNWQRLIGEILWRSWPNLKKAKERKLAIENSWQNKVEAILTLLPTYV